MYAGGYILYSVHCTCLKGFSHEMNIVLELELNDFKNLLTADLDGSGYILYTILQCCGSGIRCLLDPYIRDSVPFGPLDPGWVKNQDPGTG